MKWLFAFACVLSLVIFSINVFYRVDNNDYYERVEYQSGKVEYVDKYIEDNNDVDRVVLLGKAFISCASNCFDTATTFNFMEGTAASRFFGKNSMLSICFLPLNLVANVVKFGFYAINIYAPEVITDSLRGSDFLGPIDIIYIGP